MCWLLGCVLACWRVLLLAAAYMIMPTHECRSSSPFECAGLMTARDLFVHRCSIGAGVGRSVASINVSSSLMYCRSLPSGEVIVPQGIATSDTHCCPPQSNPSSLSDQSTRYPSDFFQYSASAVGGREGSGEMVWWLCCFVCAVCVAVLPYLYSPR